MSDDLLPVLPNGHTHLGDEERAAVEAYLEAAAADRRYMGAVDEGAMAWHALEAETPPERDWAINNWIGMGYVTLLAGPGGSGKTAIMQTALSALSLGYDVIDQVIKPRRCLMWFGEDDKDEVWRRQVAIAAWMGVSLSQFKDTFYAIPRPSEDITLAAVSEGKFQATPELVRLREQIGDLKIDVCCLDSVARIYGGGENERHQVTQFIALLNWAAAPTKAAIVPIGHPAKAEGSEFSGSTAWEASVRARMYFGFKLPDSTEDPENPTDPMSPLRYLAKRKTNYSVKDYRVVKYVDGAMIPQLPDPSIPKGGKSSQFLADETLHLVRQLRSMGIEASHAPNSSSYLPRAAQAAGLLGGALTASDIKRGLAECLRTSRLRIDTVGHYANRNPKKGLVEVAT